MGGGSDNDSDVTSPTAGSPKDVAAKADIYWAFAHLEGDLRNGISRPDMKQWLAELEMKSTELVDDDKAALIREILHLLEAGFDAETKSIRFRNIGVQTASVPWELGRTRLSEKLSATPVRSDKASPETVRHEIMTFASTYHSSPERVQSSSYSSAIEKIDELGSKLDMLEATDKVSGRPQAVPDSLKFKVPNPGLKSDIPKPGGG